MRRLNRTRGMTAVIVTHDPGVGERCDRIVRMRDGQIVAGPTPWPTRAAGRRVAA
jgi:putative ABC transport system ATP-binding protein